ncbi:MAG: hypothetical protein HYU64_12250 [Armatimonadetes bacterium]|nr:hypothetical protein [Armatimonadota bacterium]
MSSLNSLANQSVFPAISGISSAEIKTPALSAEPLTEAYDSLEQKALRSNHPSFGTIAKGVAVAPAAAISVLGGMVGGAYLGTRIAGLIVPGPWQAVATVALVGGGAFLGGGVLGGKIARKLMNSVSTPPYISYDDKQRVDPREKEIWALREQVMHSSYKSIEEKAQAADRIKALSTELAKDPDFVLFELARDGHLKDGGLIKSPITSKEAKDRLARGESVFAEYYVKGDRVTREVRDVNDIMYVNKLLESEYWGAKALDLPEKEVEAFNILSRYRIVVKELEGLKLTEGLRKPGGGKLDVLSAFERLKAGEPVVVLEDIDGKSPTVRDFDELREVFVEDYKKRLGVSDAVIQYVLKDLVE